MIEVILKAINQGDATTIEGIGLRLHVAGIEVPKLQSVVDGLVIVGRVTMSFAPTMKAMVYELAKPPKWAPEGTTEITNVLAKKKEQKLDWNPNAQPTKEFNLVSFPIKTKEIEPRKIDIEKEILAVIGHDGPSALKILQRIKNRLELSSSELNFYDVKATLLEMRAKGLVGQLKATDDTAGGWIQPRKNPLRKVEA